MDPTYKKPPVFRAAACGLFPPPQGWNPSPLQWKLGFLTTGLPGKSCGKALK